MAKPVSSTPDSPFNELAADQDERLALLLEEMGEALQVIGKIQRHGYESYHPDDPTGPVNGDLLEKELGDVRYAIELLCISGDINRLKIAEASLLKARKVGKYLHHQSDSLIGAAIERFTP